MSDKLSKAQMLETLRGLLGDVFQLRRDGAQYARLARAHGYVDGYMRVLLESGAATRQELLAVVSAERVRADGPATAEVAREPAEIESEVAA